MFIHNNQNEREEKNIEIETEFQLKWQMKPAIWTLFITMYPSAPYESILV